MIEYKLKKDKEGNPMITKDGHTMTFKDVVRDLERLSYLESEIIKRKINLHKD